jgi:hypothetical protein
MSRPVRARLRRGAAVVKLVAREDESLERVYAEEGRFTRALA